YSLGATLYVIMTGRAPFEGGNPASVQDRVRRGDFPRPREVNLAVPRALEAVCLKAMALRPEDRYASARGLADEVERGLADSPVRAYREPWRVQLRRWLGRHRTIVSTAAAATVIAAVGLGVNSLVLADVNRRERSLRALADRNAAEAREERRRAESAEAGALA